MTIEVTFPFTTAGNYTYDSNKMEVSGGKAQLILEDNESQTFNEDFADDTDFTYDSDKTEFSGGQAQQKSQFPANSTFGATYTSNINGTFGDGVLTGTGNGGAAVSGGRLDLAHSDLRYVDYDADLNADHQQSGAIKFKWTPNYSGAPASTSNIICITKAAGDADNEIRIYHTSTLLFWTVMDSAGSGIVSQAETFNPTADTTYEIEFNWDITSGATRIFIDGTQLGATHVGTGTRDSGIGLIRIGTSRNGSGNSNFYLDDLIIFDTVQHTTNYTAGYTLGEIQYSEDVITLPTMTYSGIGSIQAFTNIISTESNTPRYIINDQYYSGGWTASSDTWATSSPLADILTNIATLPVSDTIIIKAVFQDGSSQMATSDLTLTYTGQIYPTDNPTIEINTTLRTEEIETFTGTVTETGSDAVKYIIKKDSIWYYWSGSAWVESDGTYTKSNTNADITTNLATLLTIGTSVKIKIFLHSDDGSTTPDIDSLVIGYDFYGASPDSVGSCIVWGYVYDVDNTAEADVNVSAKLYKSDYIDNVTILTFTKSTTTDSNGYWELELIENENMSISNNHYKISFNTLIKYDIVVPNESSKNFNDLI